MVEKTNYKIEKVQRGFDVTKDGDLVAILINGEEEALHAIWVLEGKNPHHHYDFEYDGSVIRRVEISND